MKKINKYHKILIFCGLLTAIAAAGAIKARNFSDQASGEVMTFLETKFRGAAAAKNIDLGLTNLRIKDLSVSNSTGEEIYFTAEEIYLSWNLASFFLGGATLKEIQLSKPKIILFELEEGSIDSSTLRELFAQNQGESNNRGSALFAKATCFLKIKDGGLEKKQRGSKTEASKILTLVNVEAPAFNPNVLSSFNASAQIISEDKGTVEFSGEANLAASRFKLEAKIQNLDLPTAAKLFSQRQDIYAGTLKAALEIEISDAEPVLINGSFNATGLSLHENSPKQAALNIKGAALVEAHCTTGLLNISKLEINSDGQEFQLSGKIDSSGASPNIELKIASPRVEVEKLRRLIAALLPQYDKTVNRRDNLIPDRCSIPSRKITPNPFNLSAETSIEKLVYKGLQAEDFKGKITAANGLMEITTANAAQKERRAEGRAIIDIERVSMPFNAWLHAEDFELSNLLEEEGQPSNRISGTLTFSTESQGNLTYDEPLHTKIRANSRDGKMRNLPLLSGLYKTLGSPDPGAVRYYTLRGEADIYGETTKIKTISLSATNLQTTGTGTFKLKDKSLNLGVAAALPQKVASRAIQDKNILQNVSIEGGWAVIPLRLRGDLGKPRYAVDNDRLSAMSEPSFGENDRTEEEGVPRDSTDEELKTHETEYDNARPSQAIDSKATVSTPKTAENNRTGDL